MDIIELNIENLNEEHICCAISDKKGECGVACKKAWLKDRFSDGLVFKKLNARGKVFIEYIPVENAWCPIEGDNYMYINCFWVSGQFKGKGYGGELLAQCILDAKAKGKLGLVVLSSKKKMSFLSDPKFLKYKGFKLADTAQPYFELLYLPFKEKAPVPKFKNCVKNGNIDEKGFVLYYSHQCPHTAKYAPLVEQIAKERNISFKLYRLEDTACAQSAPTPFTTYSLFYEGKFITNEILSEKKFLAFLEERGI